MAWMRQVWVDSTVSAVRPASLLHCLVHLDVRNVQGIHIKTLHLQVWGSTIKPVSTMGVRIRVPCVRCFGGQSMIRSTLASLVVVLAVVLPTHLCIALCVFQEFHQELHRLLWPTSLSIGGSLVLRLRRTSNTTAKPTERDGSFFAEHGFEVALGLRELHLLDRHGSFARVFEVHAQIRATSFGALGCTLRFACVFSHRATGF
mmetsp:Transcript_1968/g.12448  ORF Transcript_1968/g.12448 Transcript_1968/m.12448 type:complete len:203 (-) Transcript_1968:15-623(-)